MPTHQHENTINNIQDSMSPAEPSNLTVAGPKYCNRAEALKEDLKTEFMQKQKTTGLCRPIVFLVFKDNVVILTLKF